MVARLSMPCWQNPEELCAGQPCSVAFIYFGPHKGVIALHQPFPISHITVCQVWLEMIR
jgi:hypothetical protein